MFGGKKVLLEEELANLKVQSKRKREMLSEIAGQKDAAEEQFAQMTVSHAQAETTMQMAREQLYHIGELTETAIRAADEMHAAMMEINNGIGTFVVNHAVFVEQMKKQNDRVMEMIEFNRQVSEPMKAVKEFPETSREHTKAAYERIDRMADFSQNMGVLSLNAAIEARRMGENGEKFITVAEEIRTFSEQYEKEALALREQLAASEARVAELEEQIKKLDRLNKDNAISMGKLMRDGMQGVGAYEGGQLNLRELVSETAMGEADVLQRTSEKIEESRDFVLRMLEEVSVESKEQKQSTDELESIYKSIWTSAQKGLEE